jgi:type IV pilus assembly protein PilO
MKLSVREQFLLAVLAIIALLAAGYYLVYLPLWDTHEQLVVQRDEVQMTYDETMAKIASFDKLKSEVGTLSAQVTERTKVYYPSIIQEKLMLILNDLYSASAVTVSDEAFTLMVTHDLPRAPGETPAADPNSLGVIVQEYNATLDGAVAEPAAAAEAAPTPPAGETDTAAQQAAVTSIDSMNLNVTFSATYAQVIDWMRLVEEEDRSVQFLSLSLTPGDTTEQTITDENGNPVTIAVPNGLLNCNYSLAFNAIPKLVTQDEEYEAWELTGPYGKEDPFAAADTVS